MTDERNGWVQTTSPGWAQQANRVGPESRNVADRGAPGAAVLGLNADVVLGDAPLTVTFTVTSNLPYSAVYTIDYGDGDTATQTRHLPGGVSFSHAYATPGTYDVTLTCVNDFGGVSNTATVQVVASLAQPDDISNLRAWYDFTALALAQSEQVETVPDLSGNSLTMTRISGTPVFTADSGINNGANVIMNSGDELRTPTGILTPANTAPYSVSFVFKELNAAGNSANKRLIRAEGGAYFGYDANDYFLASDFNDAYEPFDGANIINGGTPPALYSAQEVHLLGIVNGVSSAIYVNGVEVITGNAGAEAFIKLVNGASDKLSLIPGIQMRVHELCLFGKALDASDRAVLDAYYLAKYGIGA